MNDARSIVIGCDDGDMLPIILNSLKELPGFSVNTISVSGAADLITIARSINPVLIILCFRNNQKYISDLEAYVQRPQLPVLCLLRKYENESVYWTSSSIVFTCFTDDAAKQGRLAACIRSIVLLSSGAPSAPPAEEASGFGKTDSSRNMSRYVLELDQKVSVLAGVRGRIEGMFPHVDDPTRKELISIVSAIKASAMDKKLWDDFKIYFEEVNPMFLLQLAEKHPGLTPKDLKYCCYIKMNMSNDDIRNLLGINQESVRTHKYRLKKKLLLNRDSDLFGYVKSIGEPLPESARAHS